MVVAHNMLAMNANRMFGINTNAKAKSTEKLSSGYKVNRAADDAAGLAISEKMRRQIRGLTQASANCQDGVSLCQVADGALNESQDILQRMNELAIKSANGTNSNEDRSYIQQEVEQLKEELDRIANTTTFNEGIYPLKKSLAASANDISNYKYATYNPDSLIQGKVAVFTWSSYSSGHGGDIGEYGMSNLGPIFDWIDESKMEYKAEYAVVTFRVEDEKAYIDMRQMNQDLTGLHKVISKDALPPAEIIIAQGNAKKINENRYELDFGNNFGVIEVNRNKGTDLLTAMKKGGLFLGFKLKPEDGKCVPMSEYTLESPNNKHEMNRLKKIDIQAGAEAGQHIKIDLVNATTDSLGVSNVDVSTAQRAQSAIDDIRGAIKKVSEFRSDFGAQQNRLEHTIKNLNNVIENTTDAESHIRDTDMAKEMVNFSNLSVLDQVGQSMLAQANQSKQGILSLLQ